MTTFKGLCKATLALSLTLLACTAAYAQATNMGTASTDIWTTDFQKTFRTADMMHMMDKGGKGMVSKGDFMTHMGKIFDMLDKDHNGMLEKNEFIYSQVFHTN